ncbi:MAG: energy transducer TonB [Panacagrimonas sp.]
MDNTLLRMLQALGLALVFSVGLFWVMHSLIQGDGGGVRTVDALPNIDFVRLKRDTEAETITRRKPPPPPPPKQPPPPPKMHIASEAPPKNEPLPFNIPNLGLAANVGGGPFLGEMAAGAPGGGMGLFEGDIIPLQRIAPQYPRQAARDGVTGYVKIEFTVNPDGSVRDARVIEAKPRGVFDAAAITAALKWKFKPKVQDGQPVAQKGVVQVDFNLEGEE